LNGDFLYEHSPFYMLTSSFFDLTT
jgi:hypothetical protein